MQNEEKMLLSVAWGVMRSTPVASPRVSRTMRRSSATRSEGRSLWRPSTTRCSSWAAAFSRSYWRAEVMTTSASWISGISTAWRMAAQGVEALARLGGDGVGRKRKGNARVTAIGDERVGGRRVEVGLVEDEQDVLALAVGHHLVGLLLRRPAIDHPEHEQGFVQLLPCALDAHLLHDVVGVAQSGRIDEAKGEPPMRVVSSMLSRVVPWTSLTRARSSPIKVVEECRFAHIGLADDGHGNALLDGLADMVGPGQRGHVVLDAAGRGEELAAVGKDQVVVVGEVQFEFEQRGEPEQPFAQRLQGRADVALELAEGQPVGGLVGGTDQVGHGLGTSSGPSCR